ncbi:MAG: sterol desaturase family protein [Hyphomicrobiaceae bacterium]
MFNFTSISEPVLRLAAFVGVFAVMASLEWLRPKRTPRYAKARRWLTNLSMVALGAFVVRALVWLSSLVAVPLAAVIAADTAALHGWGVLNAWTAGPDWAKTLIALIVLDLAIYLQHVASHKLPLLWRLHKMHHADVDFDVTTALRFHPIEIGLSMLYKVVWVLALGPSVLAVIVFEVTLNACAMFNHANVRLPASLDNAIRRVIVTPDMHRIHHSVHRDEHNTNYGFNLSIWDRLFGTYTHAPRDGQTGMVIGLDTYQHTGPTQLAWSLSLPWSSQHPPSNQP